ncbi:tRNA (guanine37-N1)-methyltransferase [Methanohalophilus levihalophilus]|uniref:class I SAM-dependent methyltransferase n=1 Tax=Methanohalophilus levihalophilus TaxID=1431282 RepID=UPI001AEB0715|nr:RsmD family RNA methyltransferase [Methanohalophilus levihalophilus]MBP2030036.1 tRNA (guanine37-N1)-methyltransferase [Methanohalophilus levihalophilus]
MRDRGLRSTLENAIPPHLLQDVPNRFDFVGDIAIASIPQSLNDYRFLIAKAIAGRRGNIRTVLNKTSLVQGDHRVSDFEIILGESTVTTHGEYKHRYKMDVSEVFFNSRLGFERQRVISQVKEGETILVPFCGVGPFVIPAASKGANVLGIEKNPAACKWLSENIRLNNVLSNADAVCADVSDIPNIVNTKFDRIIVPTPYGMDFFFEILSPLLKKEGYLHFYTFKVAEEIDSTKMDFIGQGYEVLCVRRCGNVAAGVSRWAFDLQKHI